MQVHLLGVRGSTPAPGAEFARYGGHTSCLAVAHDGEAPTLVLDAGTGIRLLDPLLAGAPFRGTILLTHLHWDHTQGLPFCRSTDRPGAIVDCRLPVPPGGHAAPLLARAMSPPHFPIGPEGLRGRWTFGAIEPGRFEVSGFDVLAVEVPHKGGRTFGFRLSDGTGTLTYLPDHGPLALGPGPDGFGPYHADALRLVDGADLLLHDAQHTAAEFPAVSHYGHSTIPYAVGLAERGGVATLGLVHHDPNRTDEALDEVARGIVSDVHVVAGAEGAVMEPAPRQRIGG